MLVTGATGTVGRHQVAALLAAGQEVRAGVRELPAAGVLEGVRPVRLDLSDPSTAVAALRGVDRLFLLRPPAITDVRAAFGPVVAAAARQQVRRVVVLSVMGVNPALPHWRLERLVHAAGLSCTALRPSYFAQNLITAFGEDLRVRSRLRLAAGQGRVSFIDVRDVAAVAALVLSDPDGHPAGPVTLTGPRALDFGAAASVLTAELGRPVTSLQQGLLVRRRELLAAGADPAYVWVQLVINLTTRLGLAGRVTQDVPRLLGRPATTLREFVRDHPAAWA